MVTRLSRSQRQEQTRAQLLDAALRVFLRRGFHGASLDEIAEEAGYTTGAVYSNFKGKDDLFLAVLEAEAHRRFPLHSVLMLDASSIEEGLRASAREMAQYAREHPGWTGVYVEFWTHASRRPELRSPRSTSGYWPRWAGWSRSGPVAGGWSSHCRPGRSSVGSTRSAEALGWRRCWPTTQGRWTRSRTCSWPM